MMIHTLFAQGQQPGEQGGFGGSTFPLLMIGLMVLFWVVVIIPAGRRQRREQQDMLASLKRGSKVVTSAGIIGTVVAIKDGDEELTIRSEDSRLKVLRSSVLKVLGSDESETSK